MSPYLMRETGKGIPEDWDPRATWWCSSFGQTRLSGVRLVFGVQYSDPFHGTENELKGQLMRVQLGQA